MTSLDEEKQNLSSMTESCRYMYSIFLPNRAMLLDEMKERLEQYRAYSEDELFERVKENENEIKRLHDLYTKINLDSAARAIFSAFQDYEHNQADSDYTIYVNDRNTIVLIIKDLIRLTATFKKNNARSR